MIAIRLASVCVLAWLSLASLTGRGGGVAPVRVIDAATQQPIRDAILTVDGRAARTDTDGRFVLDATVSADIGVRAPGYERRWVPMAVLRTTDPAIRLAPLRVKALYLSMFGIASRTLRSGVFQLAASTEINAVVVDVKGDRGLVAFPYAHPLAHVAGAQKTITIKDLRALVTSLHDRGLYAIARIVVFTDDPLASARADLAVRRVGGGLFRDREGLAWTDAYHRDVWAYNIGVAVEAARAGFDEIQFDYVRLPDSRDAVLPAPRTPAHRQEAVEGFLHEARAALAPFNVFLAADVFGYVCWNRDDTGIGQRLETLVHLVDYLSPMLYPSSFQFGIPGYRNPVTHPGPIVRLSLDEAIRRTQVSPLRFRPWLQAFGDYAFHGGAFTSGEVRVQIDAAEGAGTSGWMLWNPRNRYSASDLLTE